MLGGPFEGAFWTRLVMQLATGEAAARHAVLALGLLYQDFEPEWRDRDGGEVALRHYNQALRLVFTTKGPEPGVVLLLSVVFTCIEFLRGNVPAAINHCRHGILLAGTGRCEGDVAALLRHLSIFPFFFDATLAEGGFPLLLLEEERRGAGFVDVTCAAREMDALMGRAVRLVRSLDGYRLGFEEDVRPGVLDTRVALLQDLKEWSGAFEMLRGKESEADTACRHLEMRWLVCWIWTKIAPHREETASDKFYGEFQRIVELARAEPEQRSTKFTFCMGTSTLLHFVVIKCRYLGLRLEALGMLKSMGSRRESIWDAASMYAIGKCIIKREHGKAEACELEGIGDLPQDEDRIKDSYVEDEVFEERDEKGESMLRRRICFFVQDGEAIRRESEWVCCRISA